MGERTYLPDGTRISKKRNILWTHFQDMENMYKGKSDRIERQRLSTYFPNQ